MSLLEELHRRVDALSTEQQRALRLWLDHAREPQRGEGRNGRPMQRDPAEDAAIGEAGLKLAAATWPREDFSGWPGFQKRGKRRRTR